MPVQLNCKLFNNSHCTSDTFWWDCVFYSWMDLWQLAQLILSTLEELEIATTALGNLRFCDVSFLPFPAQLLCSSSFAELTEVLVPWSLWFVVCYLNQTMMPVLAMKWLGCQHMFAPDNSTFGISDFWWEQSTADDSNLICYNKIC